MVADLPSIAAGQPAADNDAAAAMVDLAAKADVLNGSVIGLRMAVQSLEQRMAISEGRADIGDERAAVTELRADIAETRADVSEARADTSETRADLAEEERGTFAAALRKRALSFTRKPPK